MIPKPGFDSKEREHAADVSDLSPGFVFYVPDSSTHLDHNLGLPPRRLRYHGHDSQRQRPTSTSTQLKCQVTHIQRS